MKFRSFKCFLIIAILVLSLVGCSTEKADVDISDGGEKNTEKSTPTEKPTEEPTSTPTSTPTPTPTPEPTPVSLQFPLNADHGTAWAEVSEIKIDTDGKLVVVLVGEGAGFNGVLSFRNGSIVVPFTIMVTCGGEEYEAVGYTINMENFIGHFDLTELPDSVSIYSEEEQDKIFSAPVKDGVVEQAPSLDYKP